MTLQTPDRYLIIPAAGRGVRFKELGRQYPKCILPVEGVPIIIRSLRMLMETGAFKGAVVTCADSDSQTAIKDVLDRYGFHDVYTTVVDWKNAAPSPALSLCAAASSLFEHFGVSDADLTVVLSDLLPASTYCVDAIIDLPLDSWGVVENDPNDYARWCMVRPGEESLTFYDKPVTPPPTKLAACGVYRYSSAVALIEATDVARLHHKGASELQFSHVASVYQHVRQMSVAKFDECEFIDYGTLEAYIGNRGLANKARSFNTVVYDQYNRIVKKSSPDVKKMRGEYEWLTYSTGNMAQYVPRPLSFSEDASGASYTMEYVPSQNLRELALYLDRSYETWVAIFERVRQYMLSRRRTALITPPSNFWTRVIRTKTYLRMGVIRRFDMTEAYEWFDNKFTNVLEYLDGHPTCAFGDNHHGDLHFANMFYCFTYDSLKVIDPNGGPVSELYDVAKMCHSVFGRYDYIDSDLYAIDENGDALFYDKGHSEIERAFRDVILSNYSPTTCSAIRQLTASLFLSMIPLHTDNPVHCDLFWKEFHRLKDGSSF